MCFVPTTYVVTQVSTTWKKVTDGLYLISMREYALRVVWQYRIILDQPLFKFFIGRLAFRSSRIEETPREGLNLMIFASHYMNAFGQTELGSSNSRLTYNVFHSDAMGRRSRHYGRDCSR